MPGKIAPAAAVGLNEALHIRRVEIAAPANRGLAQVVVNEAAQGGVQPDAHGRVEAKLLPRDHLIREQTLQCAAKRNLGLAALDLADVPGRYVRLLPPATWLRLAHANEGRATAGLLVGEAPMGRSARGVSLALDGQRAVWEGKSPQQRAMKRFRKPGRCSVPIDDARSRKS